MTIFQQNKYFKWYFNIISKRKDEIPIGYVEIHHIIPRSIGGDDSSDNLIKLTAREHFICHLLLTKMTIDSMNRKMIQAAKAMMTLRNEFRERIKIGSRTYEILIIKSRVANNEMFKELWKDENFRVKMKIARSDWTQSLEFKLKQSEFFIAKWKEPEYRAKMSEALKKVWQQSEYKCLRSKLLKGYWANPDYRHKQTDAQVKSWQDPIRRAKTIKAQKLAMTEERKILHSVKVKRAYRDGKYDECRSIKRSWITDGEIDLLVPSDQISSYLSKGYKSGRQLKTRAKGIWITDEVENKFIQKEMLNDYLVLGFRTGMKRKPRNNKSTGCHPVAQQ